MDIGWTSFDVKHFDHIVPTWTRQGAINGLVMLRVTMLDQRCPEMSGQLIES